MMREERLENPLVFLSVSALLLYLMFAPWRFCEWCCEWRACECEPPTCVTHAPWRCVVWQAPPAARPAGQRRFCGGAPPSPPSCPAPTAGFAALRPAAPAPPGLLPLPVHQPYTIAPQPPHAQRSAPAPWACALLTAVQRPPAVRTAAAHHAAPKQRLEAMTCRCSMNCSLPSLPQQHPRRHAAVDLVAAPALARRDVRPRPRGPARLLARPTGQTSRRQPVTCRLLTPHQPLCRRCCTPPRVARRTPAVQTRPTARLQCFCELRSCLRPQFAPRFRRALQPRRATPRLATPCRAAPRHSRRVAQRRRCARRRCTQTRRRQRLRHSARSLLLLLLPAVPGPAWVEGCSPPRSRNPRPLEARRGRLTPTPARRFETRRPFRNIDPKPRSYPKLIQLVPPWLGQDFPLQRKVGWRAARKRQGPTLGGFFFSLEMAVGSDSPMCK